MKKIYEKCPICEIKNSSDFEVKEMMFGKRVKYIYSHCKSCDTVYLNDTIEKIDDLYPTDYYSFESKSIGLIASFKSFLYCLSIRGSIGKSLIFSRFLSKLFNDKSAHAISGLIDSADKILDIGCGNGDLIFALSKIFKGKSFTGVDPFLLEDKYLGRNCKLLRQELHNNIYEKFDLIMMNHSLEHMNNPFEVMKNVRDLLTPGGILVVRIPVCDSYFFKKYFHHWVQLDAPRHRNIFSNNSFQILLKKVDLLLLNSFSDSRAFSYLASEMFVKNISLVDKNSFFRGRFRNFTSLVYWKHYFIANRIIGKYNALNWGDQRVFYITKK